MAIVRRKVNTLLDPRVEPTVSVMQAGEIELPGDRNDNPVPPVI